MCEKEAKLLVGGRGRYDPGAGSASAARSCKRFRLAASTRSISIAAGTVRRRRTGVRNVFLGKLLVLDSISQASLRAMQDVPVYFLHDMDGYGIVGPNAFNLGIIDKRAKMTRTFSAGARKQGLPRTGRTLILPRPMAHGIEKGKGQTGGLRRMIANKR